MANSTILLEPEIEVKVKEEIKGEAEEKPDSITEDESGAEINEEMKNKPEEKSIDIPVERSRDLDNNQHINILSGTLMVFVLLNFFNFGDLNQF